MSARPGQPLDENGAPITLGVTNSTIAPDEDDVIGHVAIPAEDGHDVAPKVAT